MAAAAPTDLKDLDLFEAISKLSPRVTQLAVKAWADRYPRSKPSATAEVFTLLARASGCDHLITKEDIEEGAVDDLVERISTAILADGVADSFSSKGAKAFRINFDEFWDRLVLESHAREFLFDDYLMDRLVNFLTALSCSPVRPFRLVATVAASQVVTSWIKVICAIMDTRDTAQRQLTTEENKRKGGAPSQRAVALKRMLEVSHRNSHDLQTVISNLFQAIFAHRFRDVSAAVRTVVIDGIGTWVCQLPAVYLKDQFLKYLAWALSDKDSGVRRSGVLSLIRLFKDQNNVSALEGFTERFTARFLELIYDVDTGVAVLAVKLLQQMLEVQAIASHTIGDVYGLLIDPHHNLRSAAADLVASQLEEIGTAILGQKLPKVKKAKGSSKPVSKADSELAGLLHVVRELSKDKEAVMSEHDEALRAQLQELTESSPLEPELILLVVDAMQDKVDVLSDWQALICALSDDGGMVCSDSEDALNLINTLSTAVLKACGTLELPMHLAKGGGGRRGGQQAARGGAEAAKEVTKVLSKAAPQLIRKFQADVPQVMPLISLVREMHFELYIQKKDDKGFEELLQAVSDVFGKHSNDGLVLECISTLNFCAQHAPQKLQDRAAVALNRCLQDMMSKLKDGWQRLSKLSKTNLAAAVAAAEEGDMDPVLYSTQTALMRLYHLQIASHRPLSGLENLGMMLNKIIESVVSGKSMTKGIIQYALLGRFAILTWALHGLREAPDDREAIDRFLITRDDFLHQLAVIGGKAHELPLCSRIFQIQSDLFLLLGCALKDDTLPQEAGYQLIDDDIIRYWALGGQIISTQTNVAGSEDEEEVQDGPDSALKPIEVLVHASKLLTNGVVDNPSWLTAQLVSYLSVIGNEAKEVVNELTLGLDPEELPELYLDGLQAAWGRAEDADEDEHEAAAKQVQMLSFRIMQMYRKASPVNQRAAKLIMQGGIRFVCLDLPNRVAFLGYGLGNFIGRLSPAGAGEMAEYLNRETTEPLKSCADDEAVLVENFRSHLEARAEGAEATLATPGDEADERQAGQQQDEEQEGEEGAAAMEEEEEEDVQPTEEQVFGTRPGGAKRGPQTEVPEGEAPPRPRRRRL